MLMAVRCSFTSQYSWQYSKVHWMTTIGITSQKYFRSTPTHVVKAEIALTVVVYCLGLREVHCSTRLPTGQKRCASWHGTKAKKEFSGLESWQITKELRDMRLIVGQIPTLNYLVYLEFWFSLHCKLFA